MKQPHKVVMLPCSQSNICTVTYSRALGGEKEMMPVQPNSDAYIVQDDGSSFIQPQNLYILSDEPIKEGDYALLKDYSETQPVLITNNDDNWMERLNWAKIIATTDKSLGLPLINLDWIKGKYIPAYNAGSPITQVNLEYEECKRAILLPEEDYHTFKPVSLGFFPKLNNREVIISNQKDMFTREEVNDLIENQQRIVRKAWDVNQDKMIEIMQREYNENLNSKY